MCDYLVLEIKYCLFSTVYVSYAVKAIFFFFFLNPAQALDHFPTIILANNNVFGFSGTSFSFADMLVHTVCNTRVPPVLGVCPPVYRAYHIAFIFHFNTYTNTPQLLPANHKLKRLLFVQHRMWHYWAVNSDFFFNLPSFSSPSLSREIYPQRRWDLCSAASTGQPQKEAFPYYQQPLQLCVSFVELRIMPLV